MRSSVPPSSVGRKVNVTYANLGKSALQSNRKHMVRMDKRTLVLASYAMDLVVPDRPFLDAQLVPLFRRSLKNRSRSNSEHFSKWTLVTLALVRQSRTAFVTITAPQFSGTNIS